MGTTLHTRMMMVGLAVFAVAGVKPGLGATPDLRKLFQEGIPPTAFANVAYRYADTMLAKGRDADGPRGTGLFFDLLDRTSLSPPTTLPPAPPGIASDVRCVGGANLLHQENLVRLLYFLSELSGQDGYAKAADSALQGMLLNTPSPVTGLLPWGEHLSWDAKTDEVVSSSGRRLHELSRPWMLWERCFALAPGPTRRLAQGLLRFHVVDPSTGEVSAIANFDGASRPSAAFNLRSAGFLIRAWGAAHAHTRDPEFLAAIERTLGRCEKSLDPDARPVDGERSDEGSLSALSLAIDCGGAARTVPEPTRTRLVRFAAHVDERFCSLPHDVAQRGFAMSARPAPLLSPDAFTRLWDASRGGRTTTAAAATMCSSRYENSGRVEYRELVVAAADRYAQSLPEEQADVWPMTLGHAIYVELAAFRYTARAEYLSKAVELATYAEKQFFAASPLPRASTKSDHFESATGADTLALALAELHLVTRHITAVRAPANTLDR